MIVAIGQRALDPSIGSTGDLSAPPLPSPPGPSPDLSELLLRIVAAHPYISSLAVAALLATIAIPIAVLLVRVLGRRAKSTALPAATADEELERDRSLAERDAFRLYVFGSIVSLASSLHVLGPAFGDNLVTWALALCVATVFEVAVIVWYRLGRINIRETGKGGAEAVAPWFVALVTAIVVAYEVLGGTGNVGTALARLTIPIIVAITLTFLLVGYRRKYRQAHPQPVDQQDDEGSLQNPLRVAWRRTLIRWGLADDKGISASSYLRRRRVVRVARDAYLAEKATDPKVKADAAKRRDLGFPKLVEWYGAEVSGELSEKHALLIQVHDRLTEERAKALEVWRTVPTHAGSGSAGTDSPSGSGSATAAGSGSASTGDSGTGTLPNPATDTAGTPDLGTGTNQAPKPGTGTGEKPTGSGTSKPRTATQMTWSEVAEVRDSLAPADLLACKMDPQVAETTATKLAKAALAADENATVTDGMRAYYLLMRAAGHSATDINNARMYCKVSGRDKDTGGLGGKCARKWDKQLGVAPEEMERELQELIAEETEVAANEPRIRRILDGQDGDPTATGGTQ